MKSSIRILSVLTMVLTVLTGALSFAREGDFLWQERQS
jgi:hypothetical protein